MRPRGLGHLPLHRPSPRPRPSSSGSRPHGVPREAGSWWVGTGTASALRSAGPEPHHGCHHCPSCCHGHRRAARPQPEPTTLHHRRGLQPRFGSSLVRSLDAQQSISPPGMLSPSTRLIGGRAALLPAPRSERACSRCGQHYCWPLLAACTAGCPQSLTPRPAPIMRAVRTLAIELPMTLPCPPHSSDATHACARGRGQARRMALCADGAQAVPRSAGGLLPGGLIDISVT